MGAERSTSILEITESILLETSTLPSLLAVTVQATGASADKLRGHLESLGRERFEQERLQLFGRRYAFAKRAGKVHYRDQRDANVFNLAEIFEIQGFLKKQPE